MRRFRIQYYFCLGCLFLAACGGSSSSSSWVAKVNDASITLDQFEKAINATTHLPGRKFTSAEKKTQFLNEMIREELLFQEALKNKRLLKSESVKRALAKAFLQAYMQEHATPPSDEECKAYFEGHRHQIEEVHAAHILIKPEKKNDEASLEKARKKAEDILSQLKKKNSPEYFKELAKKYSQDLANAQTGGDLGWFNRTRMVRPFSEAAFAIPEKGGLSGVVETQFGFHIIRLIDAKRGFAYFKEEVKSRLGFKKQRDLAQQFLQRLENEASIEIDHDQIQKVQIRKKALPSS